MSFLRVVFPFVIEGVRPEISMPSTMERKDSIVSFSLGYDIDVSVDDAEIKSKDEANGHFIYTYKFVDEDAASRFLETRTVRAVQNREVPDVDALEKEMDMFMEAYESGERKLKKKRKTVVVTGEDGFMRYV